MIPRANAILGIEWRSMNANCKTESMGILPKYKIQSLTATKDAFVFIPIYTPTP